MTGSGRGRRHWRSSNVAALLLAVLASLTAAASPAAADANDAAIVIDGNTGEVLFADSASSPRYPASLTKMMTLYLVFGAIERGAITADTRLEVSANAASTPPSRLGVRAGSTIRVEDAILALVTRSANDVAVVIAENLSSSVAAFARLMTSTARSLGMNDTSFRNPHGLPDREQITTARDMATLGLALRNRFPEHFHYFSTPSFNWRGQTIGNHNRLLAIEGVDGIKTGYTRASGYNLVTSVERDGRLLVAVVMGGDTAAQRDAEMRELVATYTPRAATEREAELRAAMLFVPMPRPVRTEPAAVVTAQTAAPPPISTVAEGDADPSL